MQIRREMPTLSLSHISIYVLKHTLDDAIFCVASSLRLGAGCVLPHHSHCEEVVNSLGPVMLHHIIRHALFTASMAAQFEPGLAHDNGKRPDRIS